jgi:tRNA-splicing ligase RtcB
MEKISDKLWSWASILEPATLEQARKASTMPFIFPRYVIMPDGHRGKGAAVGSGIPTVEAIMPAAVGVDIGCGMYAVRTQFTMLDIERVSGYVPHDYEIISLPRGEEQTRNTLTSLREAIESAIPLSAGNYNTHTRGDIRDLVAELEAYPGYEHAEAIAGNWRLQLATLGSGNHFIEVSRDQEMRVWLFLHSGSRGVGNRLAQKHIRIAQEMCKGKPLPDRDLAYLTEDTPEFWEYITDLRWAQQFALLNREGMMRRVIKCFEEWIGAQVKKTKVVQCHHNYTTLEHHYGKQVWMSRKGAIDASLDTWGLIPGSMGAASYVVTGKGNTEALNTAPHGAGRNYSRSAAKKKFTMDELETAMTGIEWRHTDAFLDEAPEAYKDIDVVMEDAADLVNVEYTLRQFVNVKGD